MLTILLSIYILVDLIKSATLGCGFSIIKYCIYTNDYYNWYKHSHTYIPKAKRDEYNKNRGKSNTSSN